MEMSKNKRIIVIIASIIVAVLLSLLIFDLIYDYTGMGHAGV